MSERASRPTEHRTGTGVEAIVWTSNLESVLMINCGGEETSSSSSSFASPKATKIDHGGARALSLRSR